MHKRDKQQESAPDPDSEDVKNSLSENVSLAQLRASEQIVKRATDGLIRVENRRRVRSFVRRALIGSVILLTGYTCWRLFGENLPYEWFNEKWDELMLKIEPLLNSDRNES